MDQCSIIRDKMRAPSQIKVQNLYILLYVREYLRKGQGIMTSLKLVEIVILGATALLAAVKYILKFLECVGKLQPKFAV